VSYLYLTWHLSHLLRVLSLPHLAIVSAAARPTFTSPVICLICCSSYLYLTWNLSHLLRVLSLPHLALVSSAECSIFTAAGIYFNFSGKDGREYSLQAFVGRFFCLNIHVSNGEALASSGF
jgi:hypothetical protein